MGVGSGVLFWDSMSWLDTCQPWVVISFLVPGAYDCPSEGLSLWVNSCSNVRPHA